MQTKLLDMISPNSFWRPFIFFCLILFIAAPVSAEYKGKYPYKVGTTVGMIADIVKQVAG